MEASSNTDGIAIQIVDSQGQKLGDEKDIT